MDPVARRESHLRLAEIHLAAYEEWSGRGDIVQSNINLNEYMMDLVKAGVLLASTRSLLADYLTQRHAPRHMATSVGLIAKTFELVRAQQKPASVITRGYAMLALGNAAWMLGEREIGATYVRFANETEASRLGTHFWNEYARAMLCLVEQRPYERTELPAPRALERYWAAYLPLISDLTHGHDPSASIASARKAFAARNRDRRLPLDDGLNGTGREPVLVDFRFEGILAYAGLTE